MGTVFLCVTLFCLLASLKEKFLLKPEREERRQKAEEKSQMAGLLVQTGWESREMLVPDQTAHLIPPV